ncbi:MAG: polysaccharide deacetylase family protein [Anaerolineae bacterium]
MDPNPALQKLGFDASDRVVIIHADDLGMTGSTVGAFEELVAFGLVSSGAVMVPCPWFRAIADYCRRTPGADVGVHLTLTSEWDLYRWGPVSTRDPASGLLDDEGYFPRTSAGVQATADPGAVHIEMAAQVKQALDAGIELTHLDTHMGAVVAPSFVPAYVGLAMEHRLPFLMLRLDEAGWREFGFDSSMAALAAKFVDELEAQGMPLLDNLVGLHLEETEDRLELAKRTFDSLPPGLTHSIIHPAKDTPELRAITPRTWRARVDDYRTFTSDSLVKHLRDAGIHVIGYRALRSLLS